MSKASDILKGFSDAVSSTVEATATRIVAVHGRDWGGSSGIIVKPGVAVTAEEALDRDEEIELTLPDGGKVKATLAGRDPSTDVAVLRFESRADLEAPTPAPQVKAGSLVISVGRREGGPIAALGIVAFAGEAWRSSQGGEIDALIRADLALPRQSEGGALVDAEGNLIGMAVFGPRRRVLAIPTATLLRAAERILAHGSVARGYVGVGVQPVKAGDGRAAIVVSLDPEGPAQKAGVLLGDILQSWNGETISGPRGLVNRLGPDSVGATVELGLVRGGNPAKVSLTVTERPAA